MEKGKLAIFENSYKINEHSFNLGYLFRYDDPEKKEIKLGVNGTKIFYSWISIPQLLLFLFYLNGEPKGVSIGGLVVITKSSSLTVKIARYYICHCWCLAMISIIQKVFYFLFYIIITQNFGLS